MPKVSVIIPCYNQGEFIDEAVDSVLNQTYQDFEIIIVNDGSSDELTQNILKNYDKPKTKVIHTANQGLAAARNNGINEAAGEYILPLDADDKIGSTYLEQAVLILDKNPEVGIVYCEAQLFGQARGKWELPEYSIEEMLINNVIFCSGFFRKKDWKRVGGYDPEMRYGWEDYDFWLSLIELGVSVYQVPQILFYYRVVEGSMIRSASAKSKAEMFLKIYDKHKSLYQSYIRIWINKIFHFKRTVTESGKRGSFMELFRRLFSTSLYVKICLAVEGARNIRQEGVRLSMMKVRNYFRRNDAFVVVYFLVFLTVLVKRCICVIENLLRKVIGRNNPTVAFRP